MGHYNDRYMVFKSSSKESLDMLRDFIVNSIWEIAKEEGEEGFFSWEILRNYIRPVNETIMNRDYFLFLPPDGSKEGWTVSSIMDEVVDRVIKYLDEWNFKDEGRDAPERINYFFIFDDEYGDDLVISNRDLIIE